MSFGNTVLVCENHQSVTILLKILQLLWNGLVPHDPVVCILRELSPALRIDQCPIHVKRCDLLACFGATVSNKQ